MEEIWRQVVNYDYEPINGYEVSNTGKIYSHKSGKILKRRIDKKGYNNATLWPIQYWKVSRLVALAFPETCGKWFEGAEVDHINGIRDDNRAVNLRWVTHKDNVNNPLTIKRFKESYNCAHDEGWRKKVSEALKGRSTTWVKRAVIMDDSVKFDGIIDAAKYINRDGNVMEIEKRIIRVLKGVRRTYKGHTFQYAPTQ